VMANLANSEKELDDERKAEFERIRKAKEELRRQELDSRRKIVARADYTSRDVSPFEGPVRAKNWVPLCRGDKPKTEKMKRILRHRGYDPDRVNFFAAIKMIKKWAELEGWGKPKPIVQTTVPKEREYVAGPF
jgi:hypothetical protein